MPWGMRHFRFSAVFCARISTTVSITGAHFTTLNPGAVSHVVIAQFLVGVTKSRLELQSTTYVPFYIRLTTALYYTD